MSSAAPPQPPKAVDTVEVPDDPSVGRIQVSGNRKRRFYVYVARRQFATRPEVNSIIITALGSAIAAAVATAGELEQMKVGTISKVQTFFKPITPTAQPTQKAPTNPGTSTTQPRERNVARIAITVQRDPNWKPDENDLPRPRKENGAPPAAAPAPVTQAH